MGGLLGLAGGVAGVLLASRRYSTIRNLTIPMKSFLVTSSGTFTGIIAADHASRAHEAEMNAAYQWYENREERIRAEQSAGLSLGERAAAFARREKYKIVSATWAASMIGSFVLVGRIPGLTGQQKLVQARVYAQGLTLAVLCASAAFEISDQRQGRGLLDAKKRAKAAEAAEQQPVHQGQASQNDLWKDMVAAEEDRLSSKHKSLYEHPEKTDSDESQSEDSKSEDTQSKEPQPEDKDDSKSDSDEKKDSKKKKST